ncbi:hypothetical protein T05_15688 [Trichinella murrelli]|uniref:Uncharacterized protein n=1 Tax=Trichinella murrelli TaxID=144512 RepID=A0A0V0SQD8_9BILA|nr:hypothetical protein T05_15688 [Trichinella murrelli]
MRSKCAITKISWLNGVTQYWFRNLCGFAYHSSTI